ncbi:hypothetical protein CLAFUW4_09740 [Fulvia fulva]|uniref:Uncharacterized protein n=1 Tax=Passalora fulva TaxID=5499 RepID=A0A9Q8PIX9_PASFU|nr:uncharacterized protein CLAFUR5_12498 [Fulvia fulva]KAK4616172.1 hypothetical protein CLAFUR4_09745 [Fulvia fulva]KAK4616506.1 hypothetical protein CLAFUR0_09737 [Fulvia fulva]UJO23257.1 hypothetical protein CLAFUR5_12498 [Fulvia fulva]WPV19717.1 hypothetical protein CLAFUW4_09740 [Fulvia fulva]WPV34703.1 hypothetical protein CLAFUW7_09742 [Fulvia fulva]
MSSSRLLDLPPELRNQIYDLVFAYQKQIYWQRIGLCRPTPPSHQLALTCRQIYAEAYKVWERANQTYWSSLTFQLTAWNEHQLDNAMNFILKLKESDLRHVKQFELILRCVGPPQLTGWHYVFSMADTRGLWKYTLAPDRLPSNPHPVRVELYFSWHEHDSPIGYQLTMCRRGCTKSEAMAECGFIPPKGVAYQIRHVVRKCRTFYDRTT